MMTIQINSNERLDLYIKDEKGNLVDIDDYQYFYMPKATIYLEDEYVLEPQVKRESVGHYYCDVEFYGDYFEISNQYLIRWEYRVKGRDYISEYNFELVDNVGVVIEDFDHNRLDYLIREVRELVFDVNNPIRAFFIIRNNSVNSKLKLRNNIFSGFNNNTIEFEIDLSNYNTLHDFLFYLDDNHSDWTITLEPDINVRRKANGLLEFLTTPAGSGIDVFFEYFFEDDRLKNIILECMVQFNRDFNARYNIDNFPAEYLFAFKLLVASQVTLVRASTDAKAFSQYFEEGRIQNIMLGGKLEIGFADDGSPSIKRSINSWLDLSKHYKKLYDEALMKYNITPMPIIEMGMR